MLLQLDLKTNISYKHRFIPSMCKVSWLPQLLAKSFFFLKANGKVFSTYIKVYN